MRDYPRWTLPLAGALPAVAGAAAAVLYDSPLLMLGVLLAAAVAGATPVALSRSRPGLAGPGALLTLLVLLVVLLVTDGGGTAPAAAARELTGALARLLSFAPPIPTRVDTLTPPVIVVWAAAFAAASLAARGRRLLAAVPAVLVLIAGLLLVGRSAPAPGWVAPAVALGATLLTLGENSGRRAVRRASRAPAAGMAGSAAAASGPARAGRGLLTVLVGSMVAVLVIAVGVVGSWALSDADRVDAAARYQPPEERPQPVDPLTRLAGWAKGDPQVLARVRASFSAPEATAPVDGSRSGRTAWRWAILDDFDGARWTSSARYRPTGERLRPVPGAAPATGGTLSAAVEVDPTLTPWLPTPGAVRRVTGVGVAVGADHESIVQVTPSEEKTGYGLVADLQPLDPVDSVDRTEIATLRAGGPGIGQSYVSAPGLPDVLRDITRGFGPDSGRTDGERALGLQDLLRQGDFVSDAPPGHLYVRLMQFFNDADRRAYLRGTSEQFATAFAVLARTVGLPTRIVVGFEVPTGAQADVTVTGSDMLAWPEVYFAGQGWVRFAPTPQDRGSASPRNPPKLKDLIPPTPQPASAAPADAGSKPDSGSEDGDPGPAENGTSGPVVVGTLLAGLVLLALLVLIVVVVMRLRLRALRRRGPGPESRAIGAWRELEDAVALAGARAGPSTGSATGSGAGSVTGSASAVVAQVRQQAGTDLQPLTELARIANAAAFAPVGTIGPEEADRAWSISNRAAADLRRSAPRGRRWRWWIGPAPLRGERHRRSSAG